MEDKRRDSGGTPPLSTPPSVTTMEALASEHPVSSRRRGGAQKQKLASVNSGSGGTSASLASSSKRQAREKPPALLFPPIHTNGPCTRARVHPQASNSFYETTPVKSEVDTAAKGNNLSISTEDLEDLGAKIEAEYEAIRSRDSNVHVVPIHAGWFMWTDIHQLEQRMLPSFFNGKSENRNADLYVAIRNSLMKKFHSNPNEQIEQKHLSELKVGDLDARKEVMEFLEYWGLINYHPFPPNEPVATTVDADKGESAEWDKLFRFETVQSWTPSTPRTNLEMLASPSGLFPESVVFDELVKPDGPSVEYHCNSCSADCSRKRYHCQKQADFDLCADCFNNGKFGSDMSPSDFILMEPTEAAGTSGGNWTDQETLLLLEAIELFRDNWSEIAEHVATKTKAQCILHFVQMPIEDAFFSEEEKRDDAHKESAIPSSIRTEDSALKADPDCVSSPKEHNDTEGQVGTENQDSGPTETANPDETKDSNDCSEVKESFVSKALKEAFEAVGYFPSPGDKQSFADAGNPVMTLAAFLVRLVDPNVLSASVHSLRKFMSGNYSSEELAARHCFPLKDPPVEQKIHPNSEGAPPSVKNDCEGQKDGGLHAEKPEEQLDSSGVRDVEAGRKDVTIAENGKRDTASKKQKSVPAKRSTAAKEAKGKEDQLASGNEPGKLDTPKESAGRNRKKAKTKPVSAPKSIFPKEPENGTSAGDRPRNEPPKDEDMTSISEKKPAEPSTRAGSMNKQQISAKEDGSQGKNTQEKKNDFDPAKLKRAAATALSAAAVKAKLLADQEEEQILQLSALLVEKQLHKLEMKLAFLHDIDSIVIRGKEQVERIKVKLLQERAQIIASRMGNRPVLQGVPPFNRAAANFVHPAMRPSAGISPSRPPLSRPMTSMHPAYVNSGSMFNSVQHNVE